MRVGITGGSGFIGGHVVDRLLAAEHSVVVLDPIAPHRDDVTHRPIDITDLDSTVEATVDLGALFHLAAVSDVNHVYNAPVDAVRSNVLGTTNIWEAARRNDIGRAILASTVWVYNGATGDEPLHEDSPFHLPSSGHLYTSSKLASELVVHSYSELYGVPYTILRYGIPFGPRMRDALVIPMFVRKALAGETITINGDGLQFRNYVYVEDLADAHVRCLADEGKDQTFNLEGIEPISVRRITESIADILGPIDVEFLQARPGDFRGREISAAKVAEVLGWRATTSFDEGLRRYIDWYRGSAR
ncbi:MAG: NAD-dependent epimerase/dehydratase family protein [Actinomycetota bacterium]